jgi:hypothetical protein
MARYFPSFELTSRPGRAEWTGTVTPLDGCDEYRVRVEYRLGSSPRSRVVAPELHDRGEGRRIPHRYSDGSLCLYFPPEDSWTPQKLIAQTIIPWISLWLYYYEVWLATGAWLGGGTPHATKLPPR